MNVLSGLAGKARSVAGDVGEDNAAIHLDTDQMNIEGDDPVRPARPAGDRLGCVHIDSDPARDARALTADQLTAVPA